MSVAQRGWTLVEIMVVIAVIGLLAAITVGMSLNTGAKQQLSIQAEQLANTMRSAQSRSIAGLHDDVWSLEITSSDYTLYLGADYATRDSAFDLVSTFPSGIQATGLNSVTFDIRSGTTSDTGVITLIQTATNDTIDITINTNGRVEY